jgi:hypothetical protein
MKHLSLVLLILLATTGCKKEEKPSLASLHTKNLGGERTWKATHSYFPLQYGNDTTYSLNDTSFAIQVLGDTKIKVFWSEMINKNQQYGQPIDTTKMLYYECINCTGSPTSVHYYYPTGEIIFSIPRRVGMSGGNSITTYKTK